MIKFPTEMAFKMVDAHGLPFDVLMDLMKENDFFLDVEEFIKIASKSANFVKPDRLRNMLLQDIPEDNRQNVTLLVDKLIAESYPNGLQNKKKRLT